MKRLVWILVAAALVLCTSMPSVAADHGKKKKRLRKTEAELLIDDDLPIPDVLVASLQPQIPLQDDAMELLADVRHHMVNQTLQGIDVSHYQGHIDWRTVARTGEVVYVYVKATEGAQLVDDTYITNIQGARKAGLKVGCYHFYRPNVSPQLQFQNMVSVVSLRHQDLIPIIDVEIRGRDLLPYFQRNLRNFLNMVEKHYRVKPILYTSRDFYNKHLSGPFSGYKYMIARYAAEVPELCDNAPFVMWQYSASGRVPGIRGNVDRSCFIDNYTLQDIMLP